jgi:hypothetical protein
MAIFRQSFLVLLLCIPSLSVYAEERMEDCLKKAADIKIGMTRSEIESRMERDGGISGIYKGERFFFTDIKSGDQSGKKWWNQKFCMLNVNFRPYGIAEGIYDDPDHFAQWVRMKGWHPDPRDTGVQISAPFIDHYHMN